MALLSNGEEMKYVNRDEKLIKTGGRKAKACTKSELKEILNKAFGKMLKNDGYSTDEINNEIENIWTDEYFNISGFIDIFPQINKDISKIEFSLENFGIGEENWMAEEGTLLGLQTNSKGLSFLGCYGGGDWEFPVFFIIYHDGKKLRGYIPICGNTYNAMNKKALGNSWDESSEEDNLDSKFLQREWNDPIIQYEDDIEVDIDWILISRDIKSRIEIVE